MQGRPEASDEGSGSQTGALGQPLPPEPRPETLVVTAGRPCARPGQPMNVPVYLASNFLAEQHADRVPPGLRSAPNDLDSSRRYSRSDGTPTWTALEDVVGRLEGGKAVAFSSGMAAVAAVLELVPVGSTVVLPRDCYLGTRHLLQDGERLGRWRVEILDPPAAPAPPDPASHSRSRGVGPFQTGALPAGAALLWLETPSNPMLEVVDLRAACAAARAAGCLVAVDNTFATPLLQRPLALGADFVVHSATKFIGGHADLLTGVVVSNDPARHAALLRRRTLAGATPGAMECFLALRGIRTLAVRLAAAQAAAGEIARRLTAHPAVNQVRYPGLTPDPGHVVAMSQMRGSGAVLAFELADADAADATCAAVRIIRSTTSLGGVESSIERRAQYPGQEHVPPGLLRLSVGCEHVEDLWADLLQALPGPHRA